MNIDKTFCASPDCKNDCGRKMDEKQKQFIKGHPWYPVSYAYFCGETGSIINDGTSKEDCPQIRDVNAIKECPTCGEHHE